MYAEVLLELKAKVIDQTFTYKIPDKIKETIKVGVRVQIPFGKQILEGFVLKIIDSYNNKFEIKGIIRQIDEYPVLNEEMLELGKYMSKKTLCNLITCYQSMLPSALKANKKLEVKKKYETYIILKNDLHIKNDLQKKIIEKVKKEKKVLKNDLIKISKSSVNTLIKNNILEEINEEIYRYDNCFFKKEKTNILTDEQKNVVNKINSQKSFQPYLLHGVTGSGKTEVYLNIIENVIKNKKEALILVPEISLTPQLINTFKSRFGKQIAVLHSNLSHGEKYDEWRKIEKKEVSIVIGARSAIFAPLTNLGIIIIDEEHSNTYKQENNPKYQTIDIAIYRAKKHNIPLVLGSATPSIESYTRAKAGVYKLLELKQRISNVNTNTYLVDMKEEIRNGYSIISRLLESKINDTLNRNEQILILLNRRGYSTVTTCKNCGFIHKCKYCDIPFTYHKTSNNMRCHYCGYAEKKLSICPNCNSKSINSYGIGTEKVSEYITERFEKAKVIRMDNETTSNKGSHEKIINDFEEGKYNILVGTQMISKGLNFKNVSLVGVLCADSSLNIPDFRSAERTYALINQISGRAGRFNLDGNIIIQGFNINHYSIEKAIKNDYTGFYEEEMKIRRKLNYSPYYNLSVIKIKDKNLDNINNESKKIVNYLNNKKFENTFILGPSFPLIPKINNIYEMQIIIKYKDSKKIMEEFLYIKNLYKKSKINVDIDISPYLI